jgi:hypothetical protein
MLFFCKFEAIQIYAILFANKTFLYVKNRKRKIVLKKGRKAAGTESAQARIQPTAHLPAGRSGTRCAATSR